MAPAPAAVDANDKLIAETTSLNQTTTTMAPIPAVVDLTDETVAESLEAASRETSADARPAWFDSDAKREPHSRSDSLNLGFERGQPYLVSNNIMLPTHSYAHGYDAYGLPLAASQEQTPPSYTALSYAWGDNRDSVEVEVNGVPLDITKNLFEALRALQAPDKEVLCWADALAINQKDKEEVTAQVQMMKKIYSAASSVAIWLGMDFADSELALALIKKLSDNTSARNEGILQQLVKSRDHQPAFTALVSLFEREYWRRLWVVQEVLNARHVTVLCGSSSIPWSTYQQAADVLQKLSTLIDQTYSSWLCDGVDSVYISPKSRMSYSEVFLHLGPASFQDVESLHLSGADLNDAATALKLQKALCMCRSKFATDARDKVYGLLGVLPDDVQKHIVPDYSLSIKDVFTKAAEYIILKRKRLDVLGNAFHFPVHISPLGLPSWVPDWSHISHMTPVDWPAGRFSASASTTSKADIDSQNHRVLSTWAIEVDQVVEPGIPVCTINTVNNFILSFLHWYAMLQKHLRESNEAQKERAEDAFCRTLALDGIHPLFQAPGKWRTVTLHLFASLAEENLPELPLPPRLAEFAKDGCVDLHGVSRNAILQEVFSPSMTGRSFFFSRSGIMGMGSGYLSAGDVAVVPLGCSTPLLLRKDPDTDEYRFVSDAYLDGYMYGKAITDWSSGLLEPDRYIIH
ncbi:hypothetical protein SCUCBS95973_007205 [Sporothrix curviconia]|uniref:Heterokaryon incompatibility domain-containing protein n=1 Tax=Sporothrix curviconia TaxID=1260050 RepID=A0ABP0CBF3_9PEZI